MPGTISSPCFRRQRDSLGSCLTGSAAMASIVPLASYELFETLLDLPVPLVVPVAVLLLRSLELETDFDLPVPLVVPVFVLPLLLPMLRLPEFEPSRPERESSSSPSS